MHRLVGPHGLLWIYVWLHLQYCFPLKLHWCSIQIVFCPMLMLRRVPLMHMVQSDHACLTT